MMRAVGYIRVSTEEQAKEGISLDTQKDRISAFAHAKDWQLGELYQDEGFSGKNLDRPALQALIKAAGNGAFDVVIIYKLDRLTRKVRDLGYLIEDVFEKNGIGFTSVQDNFDTTTASGKLILNVLGSVAQWERDIISERTKDALQYKSENDEYLGTPPLGFRAEGKDLKKVDQELQVVQRVWELRGKGRKKLSLAEVARRLNEEGCQSKRGGRFYHSTVAYILKNQRYAAVN